MSACRMVSQVLKMVLNHEFTLTVY